MKRIVTTAVFLMPMLYCLGNTADICPEELNADMGITISCLANVNIALDQYGNASIDPEDVVYSIESDCPIVDTMLSRNTFDCSDLGLYTLTVTVLDACGNTNACTSDLMIEDHMGPIAVCLGSYTLDLDASGQALLLPSDIDGGSMDNCYLKLSLDKQVYTCDDLGTYDVFLYVNDDVNPVNSCWTTLTVRDVTPPTAGCHDITIALGDDGIVSVGDHLGELVDNIDDNCSSVSYSWTPASFDCSHVGGTWDIDFTFEDASGNMYTCTAHAFVTGSGSDTDCDSVSDPCDVCPSGDDTVDVNGDGVPDCSQELALGAYDPSWLCANDRILACKLKASGPQTKCIKENKIAFYLSQGDHIGPCRECPGGNQALAGSSIFSNRPESNGSSLTVYPNPASSGEEIQIGYHNAKQLPVQVYIIDLSGRCVYEADVPGGVDQLRMHIPLQDVQSGVYVLRIANDLEVTSRLFVVE